MTMINFLIFAVFQSTLPLRGATTTPRFTHKISSHFNPRAPCGERLSLGSMVSYILFTFQSTRPLRGATITQSSPNRLYTHFNPRAPCGARHWVRGSGVINSVFQSTRPLRGATVFNPTLTNDGVIFQSTRPLRGATTLARACSYLPKISIHAPLAGRDFRSCSACSYVGNFNPRAPCGARQQTCTKNMYMFVRTDKRNSFPCRTLSVRAPDEKL